MGPIDIIALISGVSLLGMIALVIYIQQAVTVFIYLNE